MNISQRELIFLDTSVILRYFLGDSIAKYIIENTSRFAINAVIFSETTFNLLKILYSEKHGEYKFYEMKTALSTRDHDVLQGYNIFQSFLEELQSENRLLFLPITLEIIRDASKIAAIYGLLPNDSLIAATCRHYGIPTIATFDEDFKRIPWLNILP